MLYVSDQYTMDHWVFTGGVKYFRVNLKDKENLLLPTGAPGYSTKLDSNSNLLPSLGVQYKLDESNEFFASYTRNFSAVPDSLLEAGAAGVDVSRVKPEKADNFDLGYRRATGNLALSATLYYIKYTDKLVSLSGLAAKDYTNGSSGVWTNIGGTESYGTEIAAHYRLPEGFGLMGSFSTTHATYTAGTPDGTITKGKRVVDTPSVIASYGLLYNAHGFDAGFIGKTTGKRYGTYDNDNAVGSVTVFDFNLGYTRRFTDANFIKSLTLGINVTNVFDKNYLSSVSIYDQGYVKSDPTGSTMLWNIGAPRTITFTLGLGF
jgi:iron complex outermembrane receptor protein